MKDFKNCSNCGKKFSRPFKFNGGAWKRNELKGKNLSGKDSFDLGIGGLASGFGGMLFGNHESRLAANTKLENCVVDTAYTSDTGFFETGIKPNEGYWIIVEEYKTKAEAKTGHKKWVKYMKTSPKRLFSVHDNNWENLF